MKETTVTLLEPARSALTTQAGFPRSPSIYGVHRGAELCARWLIHCTCFVWYALGESCSFPRPAAQIPHSHWCVVIHPSHLQTCRSRLWSDQQDQNDRWQVSTHRGIEATLSRSHVFAQPMQYILSMTGQHMHLVWQARPFLSSLM